jgi:hypothetical protein
MNGRCRQWTHTNDPLHAARLLVLLLAASFIGPGAESVFAQNERLEGPRPRRTDAVGQGKSEAERGPSQKAVEIARPFGFPITNSMVVSWIVAAG